MDLCLTEHWNLGGGDLTSITMAAELWTDCVNFGKPRSLWSWFLSFQTKEDWVWWFLRLLPDPTSLVWFSGVWSRNAACGSDIPTPLVFSCSITVASAYPNLFTCEALCGVLYTLTCIEDLQDSYAVSVLQVRMEKLSKVMGFIQITQLITDATECRPWATWLKSQRLLLCTTLQWILLIFCLFLDYSVPVFTKSRN